MNESVLVSATIAATLGFGVPLGRRLGETQFFPAMLLGNVPPALIASTLAHFAPLAISPFLKLWTISSIAFALWRIRAQPLSRSSVFVFLLFSIALIASEYRPMFLPAVGVPSTLRYDPHSVYYAIQSVEMLRADYWGRLQVATHFGLPWVRFHFFGAGLAAVAQTWIREPGLESFFFAQWWIVLLGGLAMAQAFLAHRVKLTTCFALGVWFVFGFTVFAHSLRFQWLTSSALSVFAVCLWFWREAEGQQRSAIAWAIAISVSSARLLPLGVALAAVSAHGLVSSRLKAPAEVVLGILAITYLFFTFFFGTAGGATLFSGDFFSHEWLQVLSVYRPLGWLSGWRLWNHDRVFGVLTPFVSSPGFAMLFYSWVCVWGFAALKGKFRAAFLLLVACALAIPQLAPQSAAFSLVALQLGLAATALAFHRLILQRYFRTAPLAWIALAQGGSLLLLLAGMNAITAPLLYTLFDTFFWIASGLALAKARGFPWRAATLGALALAAFRVQVLDVLTYPHRATPISLPSLSKRNDWVEPSGILLRATPVDKTEREVIAAWFGARIPWTDAAPDSMTRGWADATRIPPSGLRPHPSPVDQIPPQTVSPLHPKRLPQSRR